MIRFFLSFYIFLFFVSFKCFSQNSNVWDYKECLFVEKKQNVYILEWFHHKVEMTTDTLIFVSNSIYIGKKYTLFIENEFMYIKFENGRRKLKLKVSTNEALKHRKNRKEFYLQLSNERAD